MLDVVFLENIGTTQWKDKCNGKVYTIEAGDKIIIPINVAKFFMGDWTLTEPRDIQEEKYRVSFRRGGDTPLLKSIPIDIDVLQTIKEKIDYLKDPENIIKEIKEGVPEISETQDNSIVPGGKYVGQKWEEILKPETFDKPYWAVSKGKLKNIPDDIMVRLNELTVKEG